MDARCIQCGKLLVETAEVQSESTRRVAERLDKERYGGIGGLVGGFALGLLFKSGLAFFIGAAIGTLIGLHLLKARDK